MLLNIVILLLCTFIVLFLLGNKIGIIGSAHLAIWSIALSCSLAWSQFFLFLEYGDIEECFLYTWLISDNLKIEISLLYDSVTAIMFLVVTTISLFVHIYTFDYMKGDPRIISFYAIISMFTFFMLILVASSNFIMLFFGWEGVGVASFLLIRFWRERLSANKAAIKAMIINRIGDFGLILGIGLIFFVFKTLNFSTVFALVHLVQNDFFFIFDYKINILSLINFLLFIGAIGKSAQIGLHVWLPDAMEGPTPVSALIHAATMVTAGVFLLVRCSPLFEFTSSILIFITIIGALTAFLGATTGLVQNDLKRVIAYSTCSQLGYMVFACGLSNYSVGLFHLMNHAFFKALLFLSAGSVIHALMDEQDMRKMGGLYKILPFTYTMFLIGSLALMGFPFLTGFYSKDVILEIAYSSYSFYGIFAYWLGILSAVFTAFYSFRLLYLTFYSKTFGYKSVIYNVHECSSFMFFSLICLCIGSIFFGFLFKDLFIGLGSTFFNHSIFVKNSITSDLDAEFLPTIIKLLPVIFSLIGMLSALSLYFVYFRFITYLKINKFGRQIYLFLNKRWYFDLIYSYFISRSVLYFGYEISFKTFDKGFIELIGPLGLVRFFSNFSKYLNKLNTGFIFNYVFFFSILFFIILICFFLVVIKFNLIVSSNLYIILFFFYLLVFYKK